MATTNLGRVQGGSVFYSTATSGTSITKTTLLPNNIVPLVGDSVLFNNGDLRQITAVSGTTITCGGVVTSLKGATGAPGADGADGAMPTDYTKAEVFASEAEALAASQADPNKICLY